MTDRGGARTPLWIEGHPNPFLVREWRRAARARTHPLVIGWLLIGLCVLGLIAVVVCGLWVLWMQRNAGVSMGVGPSLLGNWTRSAAVWAVGGAAWTVIGLGYWLAVGQTWIEEQQVNLDLLLVTPLSRATLVWHLLAWPMVATTICLLPLMPLLVLMMPFLGLSFFGAVRVALVILAFAALPMVRAPSAAAVRAERRTQRSVLTLGLYGLLAVVAVPVLSVLGSRELGLMGFGLLRWPLAFGEALGARLPFWSGQTWLGGWLIVLFAVVVLGRGLAAWGRLCEGGEERAAPAIAVLPAAWLLTAWIVGGLWWGHHPLLAGADRLWYGLHLALAAMAVAAVGLGARDRWLLWWLPRRHSRLTAGWAILDAGLLALLPRLVWWLSQRGMGASSAPPHPEATVDLALVLALLAGWSVTAAGSGARRANWIRGLLAVGLPLLWLLWATSDRGLTAHGWTGRFFGWTADLQLVVGGLALLPTLGTMAAGGARASGPPSRRTGEQSLTWRLLPAAWRANPLVIKGLRGASRGGLARSSAWAMVVLAIGGLAAASVAESLGTPGGGQSAGQLALLILVQVMAAGGENLARDWLGYPVGQTAAVCLAMVMLITAAMIVILPALAATLCGKVVAQERVHGSLGFVLLSDLSDREVADGFLVGQLYPVLELLLYFAATVVLWGLASLQLGVLIVAGLAIVMLAGLVAATSAVALLGTARYATRADGTLDALVGVAAFHGAGFWTVRIADLVATGGGGSGLPVAVLAGGWAAVALGVGVLAWRATPAAFRRLRRSCRLWQAFEPSGNESERDGGL